MNQYNAETQQGHVLAGLSPDQAFETHMNQNNPPMQFNAALRYLLAHDKRLARITLNGRLVTDDFYNGNAWEIGLRRHAPAILQGDLRIAILPLRKDTVTGPGRKVYLADELLPDFGKAASVARLQSVEIIPRYQVAFPDGGAR